MRFQVQLGLVLWWAVAQFAAAGEPVRIEQFVTVPVPRLEAGRELRYLVSGTPASRASLRLPGLAEELPMREVAPGHYETTYRLRPLDNVEGFRSATATLRLGEQVTTRRHDLAFPRDRETPDPAAASAAADL